MGVKTAQTVLYVANASKIGGGNKVLMDLMQNLDPSRFVPSLVSPEPGPLVDWARSVGIRCTLSPPGDWNSAASLMRRSWELGRIIRRTHARIVHAASPMCYRALGLAAFVTGAARVCHLGFPPEEGELERSFLCGPDLVIGCYTAQAEENRARIARIKPGCTVMGISNGVNVQTFAPGPVSGAGAELRRDFSRVVAILGHVSEVKGYPTFVEAAGRLAAKYTDCLFVAIGAETTHFGHQAQLEQRIRALSLTTRFRFLGFRSDVGELLRAVDIVALPSQSEGLPLAVLEAMAASKAVIATPVGGVPEAITDGKTGLIVPPDDVDALEKAIERLLSSPEERQHLGVEARARILKDYSVRRFADRIQDAYDSLRDPARISVGSSIEYQALTQRN